MDQTTLEGIQNVVDRVSSYQDGATESTVEQELREGFAEAGLDVSEAHLTTLADAITGDRGSVDVSRLLT